MSLSTIGSHDAPVPRVGIGWPGISHSLRTDDIEGSKPRLKGYGYSDNVFNSQLGIE